MQTPVQIKVNGIDSLTIKWNEEKSHTFALTFLRDESPDAGNKGETILWRHIPPPSKEPDKPGKYEIDKIELVGDYAMQIRWKDGYDYGIYSWDLLWKYGEFLEAKEK